MDLVESIALTDTSKQYSKTCCALVFKSSLTKYGQSIQEWTKKNMWQTAFKKFEGIWGLHTGFTYSQETTIMLKYTIPFKYPISLFKGCLPYTLFWSILEPFLPYGVHIFSRKRYVQSIW